MFRAFESEFGHFALDDTWIGAVAPFGQRVAGEVTPEPFEQIRQEMTSSHLEFSDGVAEDFQGMDKADAVRVKLVRAMQLDASSCARRNEQ